MQRNNEEKAGEVPAVINVHVPRDTVPVNHCSPGSDQSPLMGLRRLLGKSPGFGLSQSQSTPIVPSHTWLNLFVFVVSLKTS